MDQADGVIGRGCKHAGALIDRPGQTVTEEFRRHRLTLGKGPHTRNDARLRTVRCPAEKLSLARAYLNRRTALRNAFEPLHRPREDPGMPAQERLFLSGSENQPGHLRYGAK